MRNTLLTLGFLLTLSLHSMPSFEYVEDEAKPYVESFFNMLDDNRIYYDSSQVLVVLFRDKTATGAAGIAYRKDDDNGVLIMIDVNQWCLMNESSKLWLVFHELSHDLLNLSHSSKIKIMNPNMKTDFSRRLFEKAKTQLIQKIKQ